MVFFYSSPAGISPLESSVSAGEWHLSDVLGPVQTLFFFLVCFPYFIVTPLWLFSTTFVVVGPRIFRRCKDFIVGRRREESRLAEGVWTIHGRRYDLTKFADQHPGGPWALELGRNRDCTCLFESYHVFADMTKLDKMLAVYELPESKAVKTNIGPTENPTGLAFRCAFHEDVKQMARDYFKETNKSHKMEPWVFCFWLMILLAEFVSAVGVLYGYKVCLVTMPVFCWLLTGNVSHEASHFALSSRPWVNALGACTSEPMCFNSTAWYIEHIIQHHVYTNDHNDVDLYHFLPLVRTTPLSKWQPQCALQWLSLWMALPTSVLHLLFVVPLDLLTGYVDPATKTRRYEQCENVDDIVAGAKKSLIFGFVSSFCWPILIFYTFGVYDGFWMLALMYTVASYSFITFTQGAHLQETCMKESWPADKSWAKRQVLTSVNFCADSTVWSLASGGLNMQALHHLLPTVSASHLHGMFPRLREVCKKHNVELKETDGMMNFFKGFVSWVNTLSVEDPVLEAPEASKVKAS